MGYVEQGSQHIEDNENLVSHSEKGIYKHGKGGRLEKNMGRWSGLAITSMNSFL